MLRSVRSLTCLRALTRCNNSRFTRLYTTYPPLEFTHQTQQDLHAFNITLKLDLDRAADMISSGNDYVITERTKRYVVVKKLNADNWLMVLFGYGSICFVNSDVYENEFWIAKFQTISTPQKVTHDNLPIVVDPTLPVWCKVAQDRFITRNADINSLAIACNVLARSVALKTFERNVQRILDEFQILNQAIHTKIKMSQEEEKKLAPAIALGNELKCDLLLNVRLFEKPESSWNREEYDVVYRTLNDEFEIEARYKGIEKQLDFIQQNSQFYLELRHSEKMNIYNWLIIILIATEIVVAFGKKIFPGKSEQETVQ